MYAKRVESGHTIIVTLETTKVEMYTFSSRLGGGAKGQYPPPPQKIIQQPIIIHYA